MTFSHLRTLFLGFCLLSPMLSFAQAPDFVCTKVESTEDRCPWAQKPTITLKSDGTFTYWDVEGDCLPRFTKVLLGKYGSMGEGGNNYEYFELSAFWKLRGPVPWPLKVPRTLGVFAFHKEDLTGELLDIRLFPSIPFEGVEPKRTAFQCRVE